MKNLIIILVILLSTVGHSLAQREIVSSGNQLMHVHKPDSPRFPGNFTYLWWYGDGGYDITLTDSAEHNYHVNHLSKTGFLSGTYVTTLITTENYGTEGNPDLIDARQPISSAHDKTSNLPKFLDSSDASNFIRITNFRSVVPNDTFYLIVTYGVPYLSSIDYLSAGAIRLSFPEESNNFKYISNNKLNESFLSHREEYLPSVGSHWYKWKLSVSEMHPGEEQTMLLPFLYTGSKTEDSLEVVVGFSYGYTNDNGGSFQEGSHLESASLKFAASHDPNSTQVSIDTTSCACGGQELEYEVQFENTGKGPTRYVRIEMQLDEAHDLSSVELTRFPREFSEITRKPIEGIRMYNRGMDAFYQVDEVNNKVTFEFHGLILTGLLDTLLKDPARAKDYIRFKVQVKPNYVIGKAITASADIFFDTNEAVPTNEVETTCLSPVTDGGSYDGGGSKPKPIPSPCHNTSCNCFPWIITSIILFLIIIALYRWYFYKKNQK